MVDTAGRHSLSCCDFLHRPIEPINGPPLTPALRAVQGLATGLKSDWALGSIIFL